MATEAGPTAAPRVSDEEIASVAAELRLLASRPPGPPRWLRVAGLTATALFGGAFVLACWFALATGEDWTFVAVLAALFAVVPLHELGHFLAMKLFGYRDVGLFFSPVCVAGATYGTPPRDDGFQAAIVALAGPLPGLAAGALLYLAGRTLAIHDASVLPRALVATGLLFLGLNLFNLLPVPGFDGSAFLRAVWGDRAKASVAFDVLLGALTLLIVRRSILLSLMVVLWLRWRVRDEYPLAKAAARLRAALPAEDRRDGESLPPDRLPDVLALLKEERWFPHLTNPYAGRAALWTRALWKRACGEPMSGGRSLGLVSVYLACWLALPWSLSRAERGVQPRPANPAAAAVPQAGQTPEKAAAVIGGMFHDAHRRLAEQARAAAKGAPADAVVERQTRRRLSEGGTAPYTPVTVEQLLRDPARYRGRRVEVKGRYARIKPVDMVRFFLEGQRNAGERPAVWINASLAPAKRSALVRALGGDEADHDLLVRGVGGLADLIDPKGVRHPGGTAMVFADDVSDLGPAPR